MDLCHISLAKRFDKNGVNLGGVEKHAMYLKKAMPKMQLLSWSDYPQWIAMRDLPDYKKAEVLNTHLLDEGILDDSSVVVCDGYWGKGLEGKVGRLVSVVHGSYFGRFVQSQIYPWGEPVDASHMIAQTEFWSDDDVEIVGVALECAREIRLSGIDKKVAVIRHGIDLDTYHDMGVERVALMQAATSARKGIDVIGSLIRDFGLYIEPMSEHSGSILKEASRLNQARILVAPTRHEGNSYLLIEALACGMALMTYATGLAIEMDGRCGIITDDLSPPNFARHIEQLVASEDLHVGAREWAEENCSFERFAKAWRKYLCVS